MLLPHHRIKMRGTVFACRYDVLFHETIAK
jgi:hypothetical protein